LLGPSRCGLAFDPAYGPWGALRPRRPPTPRHHHGHGTATPTATALCQRQPIIQLLLLLCLCVCVCVLAAPVYLSTTRHTHHTLHLHLRHPRLRSQFHANRLLASFTHPSPQKQTPTLSSASSPQPRLARLARPPVQPVRHMTPAPSSAGTSLGSRLRRLRLTAESRDARPLMALWHPRPAKVLVQVQDHLERIAAP
jgi:hypothetical protein